MDVITHRRRPTMRTNRTLATVTDGWAATVVAPTLTVETTARTDQGLQVTVNAPGESPASVLLTAENVRTLIDGLQGWYSGTEELHAREDFWVSIEQREEQA